MRFLRLQESRFTSERYGRVLDRWERHCRERGVSLLAARDEQIAAFMRQREEHVIPQTRRIELAVLSAFYRWAAAQDEYEIKAAPTVWIKAPPARQPGPKDWLSGPQALHFLRLAAAHGPVEHALTCLFLLYGQASSGVQDLEVGDFAPTGAEGPTINIAARAGRRHRLPLIKPALGAIAAVCRGRHASDPMFVGKRTDRLNRHAAAKTIVDVNRLAADPVCDAAGARVRVTPSLLTDTFVIAAVRGGAPAQAVVDLTGFDFQAHAAAERAIVHHLPVPAVVWGYLQAAHQD